MASPIVTFAIVYAIVYATPIIICALDPGCRADWWEYDKIIEHYGSEAWEGARYPHWGLRDKHLSDWVEPYRGTPLGRAKDFGHLELDPTGC